MRGPRLHRRDDASPDGSRGGSIQFANKYRGEGKGGMSGLEFSSGIFFSPFLKGRPTMIGNERLEDESNASSTLTEPISRSIRGINGSRMERGVRILYRHLRSMVFFVFLFSFLMNFTEGGRRIIRHGSAGKVSGECWRLLIISCSCLQTPFFLRG